MFKPNGRSMSITSQESYSAVMIADTVAEVPVSLESEQCDVKSVKDATNLAYDGRLDGEGKSVIADGMDSNSHVTNAGGITRGVILNAVQFGQPDSKTKSDEKAMQLAAALPIPQLTQQISEPKGFKEMSLMRKIAFGFSFLPSILFVLCFSVILPCNVPKPCVEEAWVMTFNNTEAVTTLEISENLLFAASKENKGILKELDKYKGNEEKERNFDTRPAYLRCGKITSADKTDCIIINQEGKFYSWNESHSDLLWNPISEGEQPSPPVILSDCNGDHTEEIAMVVSSTKIKILYGGSYVSSLTISHCDSFPTKLTAWTTRNSTDLVFTCTCTKDKKDILVKIPQNMWCALSENPEKEASVLYTGEMNSLNNGIMQPLEDSLVLWSGDEVSLIHQNGSQLWKASNQSHHSEDSRSILHGNFRGENKQIALLSSSTLSGLKITLLDAASGNQEKLFDYEDSEAVDATSIQGKGKDFILVLRKVKKMTDIMTTALSQINDFSTTVATLISNNVLRSSDQLTSHELSLLDSEGKLKIVSEIKDLQNAEYKTTMKAIYDKNADVLRIYLLSTSGKNEINKTSKVRNINIASWYTTKHSRCLGKMV